MAETQFVTSGKQWAESVVDEMLGDPVPGVWDRRHNRISTGDIEKFRAKVNNSAHKRLKSEQILPICSLAGAKVGFDMRIYDRDLSGAAASETGRTQDVQRPD